MFKQANGWLSKRLAQNRERTQGRVAANTSGIRIDHEDSSELISWSEVVEVEAILADFYFGGNLELRVRTLRERELRIREHDPSWAGFAQGIEANPPGSVPYANGRSAWRFTGPAWRSQVYSKDRA